MNSLVVVVVLYSLHLYASDGGGEKTIARVRLRIVGYVAHPRARAYVCVCSFRV